MEGARCLDDASAATAAWYAAFVRWNAAHDAFGVPDPVTGRARTASRQLEVFPHDTGGDRVGARCARRSLRNCTERSAAQGSVRIRPSRTANHDATAPLREARRALSASGTLRAGFSRVARASEGAADKPQRRPHERIRTVGWSVRNFLDCYTAVN
ncbi:MAG TPA: hypothetical protein VIG68_04355, partial [Lysobacter sp.]